MGRLAAFVARRTRAILVAGALAFVLGVVVGTPVAGELGGSTDSFADPASQSVRASDLADRALGRDADPGLLLVVEVTGDPRRDPVARAKVQRIARELATVEGVERVVSPLGEEGRGRFISTDGRLAVVAAGYDRDGAELGDELRARFADEGVRLGGRKLIGDEIGTKVSEDLARAELIAFPLLLVLSLLIFRSVVAAVLPLLVGGLSIVVTFVVLRAVDSQVTGLSVFALNLVTGVGLGLAIDWSLFVVSRFREEGARLGFGAEAMTRTLQTAGKTVLFSALTVSAAMASLLVFPLNFLASMGLGGVIVSLVGAVVALVVLPAGLLALGPRVDALAPGRLRRRADADARPAVQGGWYRLAQAVMRRPFAVAGAAGAILIVAGLPFLRVEFVDSDEKVLPADSQSRQVAETLQRAFPAAAADPIRLVARVRAGDAADERALEELTEQLAVLPGVGAVAEPRRLDAALVEIDVLQPGDPLTPRNLDVVRAARAVGVDLDVLVAGPAARFLDQRTAIADALPAALAILGGSTLFLLFLMTGSVVLPLKALAMNLLGLCAAFGLLVVIFQDGVGERLLDFESAGGLDLTQPVLLFAIGFGLATDYGIFLLSRIKEAHDAGLDDRAAVAVGLERTGRIVTAAAALFCVAIGAFATSGILFIKQVGVGTALAVAIDATLIRALLVPALMALLGRRNWWAPAPLRRLHNRFGISENPT